MEEEEKEEHGPRIDVKALANNIKLFMDQAHISTLDPEFTLKHQAFGDVIVFCDALARGSLRVYSSNPE